MLRYAVIFFVVAIIAAVLGFSGIAGAATNIAWVLFVVFVILAIVSLLRGRARITSSGPTPVNRGRGAACAWNRPREAAP